MGKITREQLNQASLNLLPNLKEVHAKKLVSDVSLWKMAMEHSFLTNDQSQDSQILRQGLIQFNADGKI